MIPSVNREALWEVREGHVLMLLKAMPAESVHCVVTSPPYWQLRNYKTTPQVWGGEVGHQHIWHSAIYRSRTDKDCTGYKQASSTASRFTASGASCSCGAWHGELGLEPTPELYVQHIVEVFREVKRVLRKDGTLWLNLGSSYASGDRQPIQSRSDVPAYDTGGIKLQCSRMTGCVCSCHGDERQDGSPSHDSESTDQQPSQSLQPHGKRDRDSEHQDSVSTSPSASSPDAQESTTPASGQNEQGVSVPVTTASASHATRGSLSSGGRLSSCNSCLNVSTFSHQFKPKDLIPIPWMVAMALQADGWWLRSAITLCKLNPMPESVEDRPTNATEMMFLMTKSPRYYYDQEAVREPHLPSSLKRYEYGHHATAPNDGFISAGSTTGAFHSERMGDWVNPIGRNLRNWWIVTTEPFPKGLVDDPSQGHFATFGQKWIKPCIRAGTSEKGCCATCGAPWKRIVKKSGGTTGRSWNDHREDLVYGHRCDDHVASRAFKSGEYQVQTIDWNPMCSCQAEIIPCLVLDPFCGSGTTGLVAVKLGRSVLGLELHPAYVAMARTRIGNVRPLFGQQGRVGDAECHGRAPDHQMTFAQEEKKIDEHQHSGTSKEPPNA